MAISLLVMVLLSALGVALLSLSVAAFSASRLSENRVQAMHLAEAGQAYARRALSLNLDLSSDGINDQTQFFTNDQPITRDRTAQLASLQSGASGSVTIVRHATKTVEPTVKWTPSGSPGVRAALTTNGTITIDGRDHDIDGVLIMNNGTKGVYAASTYKQKGSSRVGGTDRESDPSFPTDY